MEIVLPPPSFINVSECDTLIVSCIALGTPLDEFIFTHDGVVLSDSTAGVNISVTEETIAGTMVAVATLTLCSVTSQEEGMYQCVAIKAEMPAQASFTVNVITSSTAGIL